MLQAKPFTDAAMPADATSNADIRLGDAPPAYSREQWCARIEPAALRLLDRQDPSWQT